MKEKKLFTRLKNISSVTAYEGQIIASKDDFFLSTIYNTRLNYKSYCREATFNTTSRDSFFVSLLRFWHIKARNFS